MDTIRAKQIMQSKDNIQVLYRGAPVWIENIKDNNTAEVTTLDKKSRIDVPVYLLVENGGI